MNHHLECHVYYDSTRQPEPPVESGARVDLSADPAAGHQLIRLGISPRTDLPAVLLTEPGGKIRILGLRLSDEEVARLCGGTGIGAGQLTVYSSAWCPDCRRAKRVLEEVQASFEEVDIDRDAQAEAMVLERSGGRRVVPTLRFDDRLWAFNPDPPLLRRLLRERGAA
ncbi:MAG TPA: glutaredoxin family protein [Thermoanaerobaculia bacterium]|nr:glutaredoxin family protein [Thermoanaerobaculia bacterium]